MPRSARLVPRKAAEREGSESVPGLPRLVPASRDRVQWRSGIHPSWRFDGENPNTRFVARSCLNCHNAIHGSNAPSTRGKFLTR